MAYLSSIMYSLPSSSTNEYQPTGNVNNPKAALSPSKNMLKYMSYIKLQEILFILTVLDLFATGSGILMFSSISHLGFNHLL